MLVNDSIAIFVLHIRVQVDLSRLVQPWVFGCGVGFEAWLPLFKMLGTL